MINQEQIEVVQSTWKQVVPIADAAADIFYTKLFEMDPSLRSMFPEDMAEQKKKLLQTLGRLVSALHHLEDVVPDVEALGVRHVGYGVQDEHYITVGGALLSTLEKGLGDAWTQEAKEAWTAVYSLVSNVMIGAARKAQLADASA
ncbi:MAG: globin family protein [Myxococcales bacterium]|nr:globin family protein [Myxococcales bacterium]MDD9965883.1 globin family protein [Myxococcales bacterium]